MTLSDELLHTYDQSDRPAGNRNRAVPVVPLADNRPWGGFVLLICAGCAFFAALGGVLTLLWSL